MKIYKPTDTPKELTVTTIYECITDEQILAILGDGEVSHEKINYDEQPSHCPSCGVLLNTRYLKQVF